MEQSPNRSNHPLIGYQTYQGVGVTTWQGRSTSVALRFLRILSSWFCPCWRLVASACGCVWCCRSSGHCTNIGTEGYASKLLSDTIALRAMLKKTLLPKLAHKGKFWILDSCAALVDPAGLAIPERLKALSKVSAFDGVHQTVGGYQNIATNIVSSISDLTKGMIGKPNLLVHGTSALSVAGGTRWFTWHGFHLPIGARAAHAHAHVKRIDRDRIHRNFSPNRCWIFFCKL